MFKVHFKNKYFSVGSQHIRYGLTPFFFGILLPSVATSYMLDMLSEIFAMVDKWNYIKTYQELAEKYLKYQFALYPMKFDAAPKLQIAMM